jgi:hypothetical protein
MLDGRRAVNRRDNIALGQSMWRNRQHVLRRGTNNKHMPQNPTYSAHIHSATTIVNATTFPAHLCMRAWPSWPLCPSRCAYPGPSPPGPPLGPPGVCIPSGTAPTPPGPPGRCCIMGGMGCMPCGITIAAGGPSWPGLPWCICGGTPGTPPIGITGIGCMPGIGGGTTI